MFLLSINYEEQIQILGCIVYRGASGQADMRSILALGP